jgi:ascorbate-specific PTS system EIIC-type component UlaA
VISVVLAAVVVLLGLVIIGRSLAEGVGGGMGLVLGALFVVAGAGRLYLARRS